MQYQIYSWEIYLHQGTFSSCIMHCAFVICYQYAMQWWKWWAHSEHALSSMIKKIKILHYSSASAFNASAVLAGRRVGHPAWNNGVLLCWGWWFHWIFTHLEFWWSPLLPASLLAAARYRMVWHCGFYRATLCVSAVFAVVRCASVCHVGALYPHGWRYRQTSRSAW